MLKDITMFSCKIRFKNKNSICVLQLTILNTTIMNQCKSQIFLWFCVRICGKIAFWCWNRFLQEICNYFPYIQRGVYTAFLQQLSCKKVMGMCRGTKIVGWLILIICSCGLALTMCSCDPTAKWLNSSDKCGRKTWMKQRQRRVWSGLWRVVKQYGQ